MSSFCNWLKLESRDVIKMFDYVDGSWIVSSTIRIPATVDTVKSIDVSDQLKGKQSNLIKLKTKWTNHSNLDELAVRTFPLLDVVSTCTTKGVLSGMHDQRSDTFLVVRQCRSCLPRHYVPQPANRLG